MFDPRLYTTSVRYGLFEGEYCFEARVRELPDVAEYADTHEEAYALALDTISTTATIFAEKGRAMPEPEAPTDDFSGRVTLRLPKSLHRGLAVKAVEENVSLNQLLVSVLSAFRGFDAALNDSTNGWTDIPGTKLNKHDSPKRAEVVHLQTYPRKTANW